MLLVSNYTMLTGLETRSAADMSYNIAFVIWRINISLGEESPNAGSCLMLSNIAFGMSGINIYIVRSPMDHHIMMIIIISEINIYILGSPLRFWSLYLPDVPSFMLNLDNSAVE